jgi:GntR family transcriptional repressor for pyruvate dehydrogenase complex
MERRVRTVQELRQQHDQQEHRGQDGAVGLPRLRREGLTGQVVTILKRYILAERLPAGWRLPPERNLADALNVSRTVLREALSHLIGEGILDRPSPRALRVAEFDRARVANELAPIEGDDRRMRDLIELRVIIERGSQRPRTTGSPPSIARSSRR